MVSYKELGLVNTRKMFAKAVDGGYAIPAFNFNNMEQMQAIIMAAVETKSPVILQVSKGARNYANQTLLRYMAQGAVEYAKELGCPIIALSGFGGGKICDGASAVLKTDMRSYERIEDLHSAILHMFVCWFKQGFHP